MLGISAIAYMIVSLLVIFALSAFLGQYCMQRGVEGPESVAKRWAMLMRGTEVIVASGALYILWKPILHAGESGPHGHSLLNCRWWCLRAGVTICVRYRAYGRSGRLLPRSPFKNEFLEDSSFTLPTPAPGIVS
jgi:hypothetical protein